MHQDSKRRTQRTRSALVCCVTATLVLPAPARALPPAAPSQPVTETLHGVTVHDPYRNLENLKSNATQAWLKAQGDTGQPQPGLQPIPPTPARRGRERDLSRQHGVPAQAGPATGAQAVAAGAKATMPVADMLWGDRCGQLEDPFGHRWSVATHTRDLSPEQVLQGMSQMMSNL
jgi:hypothetical protein